VTKHKNFFKIIVPAESFDRTCVIYFILDFRNAATQQKEETTCRCTGWHWEEAEDIEASAEGTKKKKKTHRQSKQLLEFRIRSVLCMLKLLPTQLYLTLRRLFLFLLPHQWLKLLPTQLYLTL
jgi:hypothetical protein